MKIRLKFVFPVLLFISGLALADADGPDYYCVHGVAANDTLIIHSKADLHSEKLGEIPSGADCVRNLGCKGGLSLEEYINLSKKEQAAAIKDHPRWCYIEYQEIKGWVTGRFLAEGSCDK